MDENKKERNVDIATLEILKMVRREILQFTNEELEKIIFECETQLQERDFYQYIIEDDGTPRWLDDDDDDDVVGGWSEEVSQQQRDGESL